MFLLYIGVLVLSIPMALVLFALFGISRRRVCLLAALLWLLPIPYELLVQSTCTGECNPNRLATGVAAGALWSMVYEP